MAETDDPNTEGKSGARKRRDAPISVIRTEDLPALIKELYYTLSDTPLVEEGGEPGEFGTHRFHFEVPRRINVGGRRLASISAEEEEMTRIYDRLDHELAVEEARADRLLRLYNL